MGIVPQAANSALDGSVEQRSHDAGLADGMLEIDVLRDLHGEAVGDVDGAGAGEDAVEEARVRGVD